MGAGSALVSLPVPGIARLAGYAVAIASERRRTGLADLLEGEGARGVSVQAVRAYTMGNDAPLRAVTEAVMAAPIDEFVVSANFGFATWLRAAARWGLADGLLDRIGQARLLASNARAADGLREAGFTNIWSTAAGTTEDLVRYLSAQPINRRRIVVQCDSPDIAELCAALRTGGGDVVAVPTYQCAMPAHVGVLRRLGEQIVLGQVDAVVLTSPEATGNLLSQARTDGRLDAVCNAFVGDLPVVCAGQLSAAPLHTYGVHALTPPWPGSDEIVEVIAGAVSRRAVHLVAAGYRLEVRGQAVIVNGQLIPVAPGPIGVLRALARHPGQVLSCGDIRREAPRLAQIDDHAIEMAVSRLRRSLNDASLVQTVLKRGYRLPL